MRELLQIAGALAGLVALVWRVCDELAKARFLRVSLSVKAPVDGWLLIETGLTHRGWRRRRISNALILVGPADESPVTTANLLLASAFPAMQDIASTDDLEWITAPLVRDERCVLLAPFYYSEKGWIADETLSYTFACDMERFMPGRAYAVRFFLFGGKRLHRSTQDCFVIPEEPALAPAARPLIMQRSEA